MITDNTLEHMKEILDAYGNGQCIQVLIDCKWNDIKVNDYRFNFQDREYRIKPTDQFLPYDNPNEFIEDSIKHNGWIEYMIGRYVCPEYALEHGVYWYDFVLNDIRCITYQELSRMRWRDDKSPCAKVNI